MNISEYLVSIKEVKINTLAVNLIENQYGYKLSDVIKKIVSSNEETIFLEGDCRVLSFNEILNASNQLQVDFVNQGIIPIIDSYNNDFIVYDFNKEEWSYFNIIDECIFESHKELTELINHK